MSVSNFLSGVYSWLCDPRNRSVEDFHYQLAELSECESMEQLLKHRGFRKTIRSFLEQRALQMNVTGTSKFFSEATTRYIKNLFS